MATWHAMALTDAYQLSDRYLRDDGRVFLSGSQALARFPLEQLRADRRAGLRTGAFVTGYPGSPLANYDRDIASAAALATADGYQLVTRPAMNEELGATAVMGSQLTSTLSTATVEGVIGVWYGKGPGLDRAGDALRHANFAGTSARGGAVALVGDDPNAKSSTIPSAVTTTIVDLLMPLLYPGDVQEAIDLGRHAIALSRASGLWSAMRIVESVADGSGSVELHPERISPVIPVLEVDGRPWSPRASGRILTPDSLAMEREMHQVRLEIARRYAVDNRLNDATVSGPDDRIGIIASGYSYLETREALNSLGLRTDHDLRSAGIRLVRLSMPWPLDAAHLRDLTRGLREVVVVEDKAPLISWLLKDALYALAERPEIADRLFPAHGALDVDMIAAGLRTRLAPHLGDRLAPPPPAPRTLIPLSVTRSPYFCSGCPHNTGTRTPDGALIGGGIGCHSMVMLMEPERAGNIVGLTSMGNEGSQWFGMTEFVSDPHIIQNIGDGTLFHSGMTAIRAGIASGTNITYKVLYNGTVAMTGGQDAFGQVDVLRLAQILMAEGVKGVIVTTDDLSRYRSTNLPSGLRVWGRHRIVEAQELLAALDGCTVLIHDQRCAAEKRRDRKRNRIPAPGTKVVINERVCEGCGDCGDVSNCLSVQPVETPFGRKTRIDQASCNHDLSCLDGDCPSFMIVKDSKVKPLQARRAEPPSVPSPAPLSLPDTGMTIRLGGIGGTGVVTVSQVLGTAAMLQGLHVRGLDQTGLSQKAGPVVSDIVLTTDAPSPSNRAHAASVDVLLAFDQLVGGSDGTVRTLDDSRTVVVANTATTPTGSMILHPERAYPVAEVTDRLAGSTLRQVRVDAARIVPALLGDDSTVNIFMTGVAVQAGLVPLDPAAVERAITLNGVAVDKNLTAFTWGRAWSHDSALVERTAFPDAEPMAEVPLRERLVAELHAFGGATVVRRFEALVDEAAASAGGAALADAVARHFHKLLAYKDEYEVARLLLAGRAPRSTMLLHPPMLRSLGWRSKIRVGAWGVPFLVVLRSMRHLRGTWLDPFGHTRVRRLERTLPDEYESAIRSLLAHISTDTVDEAVAIASLPDRVRGYEHLKLERAEAYRTELARRVAAFSL